MSKIVEIFDPTGAERGSFDTQVNYKCSKVLLWNESNVNLIITTSNGYQYYLPAWVADVYDIKNSPVLSWVQDSVLASASPPTSRVVAIAYNNTETITGVYPTALVRQITVGNDVPVSSNVLVNQNQPTETLIVQISPKTVGTRDIVALYNNGGLAIRYVGADWNIFTIDPDGKLDTDGPFKIQMGDPSWVGVFVAALFGSLRIMKDTTNYTVLSTDSGGDLTINPTGGDTNVTGNLNPSGNLAATGTVAGSNLASTASLTGSGSADVAQIAKLNAANAFDATSFQQIRKSDATNTIVTQVLRLIHGLSSGVGAAGIGVVLDMEMPTDAGTERVFGRLVVDAISTADAARLGAISLQVMDGSTIRSMVRAEASAATTGKLGFFAATPVLKPAVTGSRGGNAALASLLTQLASLGLITDSTTA